MEPYRLGLPLMFPARDDPNQLAQYRQNVAVAMPMRLADEATAVVNDCYSETLPWLDRQDYRPSVVLTVNEEMKYDCC